jgi:serine/threonine protein kinase
MERSDVCKVWYNNLLKFGKRIKSTSYEYGIIDHFGSSGNGEIFLAITSDNFLVGLKIISCSKVSSVEKEVENSRLVSKKAADIFLPLMEYFILEEDHEKFYVLVLKFFEGYVPLYSFFDKNLFHQEQREKIKGIVKQYLEIIHKLNIAHLDIDHSKILVHRKTQHVRFFDLGFSMQKSGTTEDQFRRLAQKDICSIEEI